MQLVGIQHGHNAKASGVRP